MLSSMSICPGLYKSPLQFSIMGYSVIEFMQITATTDSKRHWGAILGEEVTVSPFF